MKKALFLLGLCVLGKIVASDGEILDKILQSNSLSLQEILKDSSKKTERTIEADCLILYSELMQEKAESNNFTREQELQDVRKQLGFDKK